MNDKAIALGIFLPNYREDIIDILTSEQVGKTYMLPVFEKREDAIPLFNRLMELSENQNRYVRCITIDGSAIGFLNDVEIQDGTIELGYVIHPKYHNRGYMTRALTAAIAELSLAGYDCVICGAFEENKASIRVMEKCGMEKLQKSDTIDYRGRIHQCVYYSTKKG